MEEIRKNDGICNKIISLCGSLGLSNLMEDCEGFNPAAEFAIPLEKEMLKYPMLSFVSGIWMDKSQEKKIQTMTMRMRTKRMMKTI